MAQASHQEEILGKAYDLRLIKRLWLFIRPYKRLFYISLLLLPLQQALGLAQPYLMKVGIDRYIAGKDLWGLQTLMLLFLGALIGETLAAFGVPEEKLRVIPHPVTPSDPARSSPTARSSNRPAATPASGSPWSRRSRATSWYWSCPKA